MVSLARRNSGAVVRHARGPSVRYRLRDEGDAPQVSQIHINIEEPAGSSKLCIEGGGRRLVRFIEYVLAKYLGCKGRSAMH